MQHQKQFIRQSAAVFLACGLIAGLLPGFAVAQDESTGDNQWGPGYQITPNGLRIDGIRADNPTNRVIFDNDWFFDDFTWLFLAAQAKLGRVDFRGFIVTRDPNKNAEKDVNASVTNAIYATGTATGTTPTTLGLENASGTRQQGDSLDATRFVAGSSFLADTMHARFTENTASGVMRMAIYADNSGSPGTVLGYTAEFAVGSGLRSAALKAPVEITEGSVYWIATWVQRATASNVTFVANVDTGTRYRTNATYSATASFPSSPQMDHYKLSVDDFNRFRDLAIQSGLNIPKHIDGAREPLKRPGSGIIDDTQYTLSDGARLIIQQAEASTPDNPLLVFVGGHLTTVATALLEKPSIANRMIVFGAGNLEGTYNSKDGWATYVTAMSAPVVHYGEPGVWHKGAVPGQLDSLPDNPVIRELRKVKDHGKNHSGIYDAATVIWLFNQRLATGAKRRDLTGQFAGRPLSINVDRSPYGYLHLPDDNLKFEEMIDFQVVVLTDPRVWTQKKPNFPNATETSKD